MRNFILIAAMVLASAGVAQAGESRSLITSSTPGTATPVSIATTMPNVDQVSVPQQPAAPPVLRADNDTPSADMQRQNDTPRTDAPRYNVRPAPVETPRATTTTPPANQDTPAATNNEPPPRQTITARPSRDHREYHANTRGYSHQQRGRLNAGRIIAALHRYGIYW